MRDNRPTIAPTVFNERDPNAQITTFVPIHVRRLLTLRAHAAQISLAAYVRKVLTKHVESDR
jgi:predicted HicB family RNase H-like nuclease